MSLAPAASRLHDDSQASRIHAAPVPLPAQLLRFLVVGTGSVVTDLLVYRLLISAGLDSWQAKGLSYLAGMALGFVANKLWTFESRAASAKEPVLYVGLYAATLAANVLTHAAALEVLGPAHGGWAFLLATGLTTVLNFVGMRWLVFTSGQRSNLAREA